MIKKAYQKPTINVVKLQHKSQILAGSVDQYGMNRRLQGTSDPDDEVEYAW